MAITNEMMVDYITNNIDQWSKNAVLKAMIGEYIVGNTLGECADVNQPGFDYHLTATIVYLDPELGVFTPTAPKTSELKMTYTASLKSKEALRKSLTVWNLRHKEGSCEYVHIIDALRDRHFMVPADVMFTKGIFRSDGSFVWAANYNEHMINIPHDADKRKYKYQQKSNTDLLLKYEIEVPHGL